MDKISRIIFLIMRQIPLADWLVAAVLRNLPPLRLVRSLRSRIKELATAFYGAREAGYRRIPIGERALFQVHLADHSGMLYFDKQAVEPVTLAFVSDFLDAGDCFIDIGANRGLYSVLAADKVGTDGHVYSFEANPIVFQELTRNQNLNKCEFQMHVFGFGLHEKDDEIMKFYVSKNPNNTGLSTFSPDAELIASGKLGEDSVERIPVRRFDTVAKEMNIKHIDLIKIDTEGAEFSVLNGMVWTLEVIKPRAIIVETNTSSELVCWLQNYGYEYRVLETISHSSKLANLLFTKS